jgi:hypothetical protein
MPQCLKRKAGLSAGIAGNADAEAVLTKKAETRHDGSFRLGPFDLPLRPSQPTRYLPASPPPLLRVTASSY